MSVWLAEDRLVQTQRATAKLLADLRRTLDRRGRLVRAGMLVPPGPTRAVIDADRAMLRADPGSLERLVTSRAFALRAFGAEQKLSREAAQKKIRELMEEELASACMRRAMYFLLPPDLISDIFKIPIAEWTADDEVPLPAPIVFCQGTGLAELADGVKFDAVMFGRLLPDLMPEAPCAVPNSDLLWWEADQVDLHVAYRDAWLVSYTSGRPCAMSSELARSVGARFDPAKADALAWCTRLLLFLALKGTRCVSRPGAGLGSSNWGRFFVEKYYEVAYDGDLSKVVFAPALFTNVRGGYLMDPVQELSYASRWPDIMSHLEERGYTVSDKGNGKRTITHAELPDTPGYVVMISKAQTTQGMLVKWLLGCDQQLARIRKQQHIAANAEQRERAHEIAVQVGRDRAAVRRAAKRAKPLAAASVEEVTEALVSYLTAALRKGRTRFTLPALQAAAYHRTNRKTVREQARAALKQLVARSIMTNGGTASVNGRRTEVYHLHPDILGAYQLGGSSDLIRQLWTGEEADSSDAAAPPGAAETLEPPTASLVEVAGAASALDIEEDQVEVADTSPVAAAPKVVQPVVAAVSGFDRLLLEVLGDDLFTMAVNRLLEAKDYERLMQLVVYSNDEEKSRLIIQRIAEAKDAASG